MPVRFTLCNTWRNANSTNILPYFTLQGSGKVVYEYDENGEQHESGRADYSIDFRNAIDFVGVPVLETEGDPLNLNVDATMKFDTSSRVIGDYNYIYVSQYEGYFITSIKQLSTRTFNIKGRRDVQCSDFDGVKLRVKSMTFPDLAPTDPVEKIVNYPISNIPATDTSASILSKDIVDNSVSDGRLYMVLSQNKTDVPDLQNLASQGDIADLLKNMSFSSLESFTDNFDDTTYYGRRIGSSPGNINPMNTVVPGGYFFMAGSGTIEILFRKLRDDPHFANIVQDMWWSPLTFGSFPKTLKLEGIAKEPGITMYEGGETQELGGSFKIDMNLQNWFSKYSVQWAGQEITWSPSDYDYKGTQTYYWQVTRAISSSDSDKLALFLNRGAKEDVQIGVISNPVVKINPVTRSFTTSLQSSFYSILTGNTLGLLGYTASNIGKHDDDDDDGKDKEKVNPIMKMLADIFSGIAGTLLFSGSVAPLKDAQNAVATGGGAGSNQNSAGNIVPQFVKNYPGDLGFKIANSALHSPTGAGVKQTGIVLNLSDLEEGKFYAGDLIGSSRLGAGVGEQLTNIFNSGVYIYGRTT